jgi:2-polyprenyl-3-methyl-5-hydroxy-6-metoxy-1,4-benzoquinol methylase
MCMNSSVLEQPQSPGVDQHEQQQPLPDRFVQWMNGGAMLLMISAGHRTGLFDTMADLPASTSARVAEAAGLSERYVREWLGAMVTGGVVEYDERANTYLLPADHARWLTRSAAPNNLAVTAQWIAVMGAVEDRVVDAFRHGKGVPYAAYKRFHQVMSEESGQTVVAALREHILPIVPGLTRKLEQGIDVLDIACGSGLAMIELAASYPHSRFAGYDASDEAIAAARIEARRRGLRNVRFEVRDVAAIGEAGRYDLVTGFDAIHDQAKPARVLSEIHAALKPGGTFLMQDILACSHVNGNKSNPLATFIYTISTFHCMSVSLANGGPGLGAAWGKEKALEMLAEAGFRDVTVQTLPHDPLNYYYVAKPGR